MTRHTVPRSRPLLALVLAGALVAACGDAQSDTATTPPTPDNIDPDHVDPDHIDPGGDRDTRAAEFERIKESIELRGQLGADTARAEGRAALLIYAASW